MTQATALLGALRELRDHWSLRALDCDAVENKVCATCLRDVANELREVVETTFPYDAATPSADDIVYAARALRLLYVVRASLAHPLEAEGAAKVRRVYEWLCAVAGVEAET